MENRRCYILLSVDRWILGLSSCFTGSSDLALPVSRLKLSRRRALCAEKYCYLAQERIYTMYCTLPCATVETAAEHETVSNRIFWILWLKAQGSTVGATGVVIPSKYDRRYGYLRCRPRAHLAPSQHGEERSEAKKRQGEEHGWLENQFVHWPGQ